eukprot:TRINITY_DN1845_c0_g1_i2.p2 TRINITY_DN1845_c0_g1~~TRINITY_DN1845_c0_g1_i2.p2  ORF type:complete len:341 (+),score=57.95 TRINITY_DN1845_c0_g1_i2:2033-3055(+)
MPRSSAAADAIAASMCMNYSAEQLSQTSDWVWVAEYGLYFHQPTQMYYYYDESQKTYMPYNSSSSDGAQQSEAQGAISSNTNSAPATAPVDASSTLGPDHQASALPTQDATNLQSAVAVDHATVISSVPIDDEAEKAKRKSKVITIAEKKMSKSIELWSKKSKEIRSVEPEAGTSASQQAEDLNKANPAPVKISFKIPKAGSDSVTTAPRQNVVQEDVAEPSDPDSSIGTGTGHHDPTTKTAVQSTQQSEHGSSAMKPATSSLNSILSAASSVSLPHRPFAREFMIDFCTRSQRLYPHIFKPTFKSYNFNLLCSEKGFLAIHFMLMLHLLLYCGHLVFMT